MSVWRTVGMECDNDRCLESIEYGGAQAVVSRVVAAARASGWLVSRDMMLTFCPEHRPRRKGD